MKLAAPIIAVLCFFACKKTATDRPLSKTDYIPINSTITPRVVNLGQPIVSRVNCGFTSRFADIRFLNFEVKESATKRYQVKAKAFYSNINYNISLPVVSTFDTTLSIQTPVRGQYILDFYSFDKFVESDTIEVQ